MVRLLAAAGVALASTVGTMQLRSADFSDGAVIPASATASDCGGANRSPNLAWGGAPQATKSFALIVHDPDAPMAGGFYHWVVYNLKVTDHGIAAGAKLASDQIGKTSEGDAGYYGPCPPPGQTHHYTFTLYALDIAHVSSDAPLSALQLQARIAGHILARGILHGTETRH